MDKYKCNPGDIVRHKGRKVSVYVVLVRGAKPYSWKNNKGYKVDIAGKKAIVSVCSIMSNGQILTRSPFFIGDNWEHDVS